MVAIIGVVVLMVCVFGAPVLHGEMGPILEAAPHELFTIFGAAIGGMLIGNSGDTVKATIGGIAKVFKGPSFHKADYLATIFLVSKLMKVLKAEGAVALEAHIETPESSAIFAEFPKVLKEHSLLHLITDTVRLMVVSQGNLDPMAVEDVMNLSIKTHHHGALKAADSVGTLAGAVPALGIVACVLGVVKTMGAIDQPPTVLGGLIGSALVGTFMGVFLAYGFFEPFSKRLTEIINDEGEIYGVVKQIIVGTLNGHPMPLIIEAARVGISHHNQPSFAEVFDGMRG